MSAYLDLNGLRTFKTAQDAYNRANFASIDSSTGILKSTHLPSGVKDVIDVRGDYTDATNPIFYKDNDGSPTDEVITNPERGKIYCDITTDNTRLWRWTGEKWVEIGTATISDADVLSLF